MKVLNKSKIFLGIATVVVVLSWVAIAILGLNPGIDLAGGTEWRVDFGEEVISVDVTSFILSNFNVDSSVSAISDGDFIIRLPEITEEAHQEIAQGLKEEFGSFEERSFSTVGPVIGQELKSKAIWAIFFVLLGISLFVAWAFREVSKPINSWKYGITSLVALVHDISIPAGVFAVLGYFYGIEVDTTFIIAILVVLGFSVNDTIVVFDRIKENFILSKGKNRPLFDVINESINETIMRSINTSLTLVIVLVFLLIFGPETIFYFVLTILIGTIAGTYSSIFVASPLLYLWGKKSQ
ncbi:MAG: protein translocase subunit SecF [Candidatus Paceibacterota bacterium]